MYEFIISFSLEILLLALPMFDFQQSLLETNYVEKAMPCNASICCAGVWKSKKTTVSNVLHTCLR